MHRCPTEAVLRGIHVRGIPPGSSPCQVECAMPYKPIHEYGIIGNMRTAALVATDGSIDWFCYPHFDSPSVFAALLDDNKGGRFRIAPVDTVTRYKQFYWPDTNVLITRFLTSDGIGEIQDFMPVGMPESQWLH